jgi:hypothetical protein
MHTETSIRERERERERERYRERERERLGDDEIQSQRIIYTLSTYTYTLVHVVYLRTIPCASTHGTDINEGEPGIRA